MQITRVLTMVLVHDIDRAVQFYRDSLGLSIELEEEDWAVFSEGVGLMVSPEPLPADNMNLNSVVITLSVPSVADAYGELVGKGIAFLVPPTDVGGATVASFRDSEGNILQLVQSN